MNFNSDGNYNNQSSNDITANDINFKKKLELSYQQCIEELTNPLDWENRVADIKYKINPNTGMLQNELIMETNLEDNIDINIVMLENIEHSYVFKRSHFYRNSSRLKHEIETTWNKRGYYVRLIENATSTSSSTFLPRQTWKLKISWKY
jgi:hypothetical protein